MNKKRQPEKVTKDNNGLSRGFNQGLYNIKNASKYLGKTAPVFRSGWERDVMYMFDNNTKVLKWESEPLRYVINYKLPDATSHRYTPDFYVEMIVNDGSVQKMLIEIKPKDQSMRHTPNPKEPKVKNTKTMAQYNHKMRTRIINQIKWETTEAWLRKYHPDVVFMVITEEETKVWGKYKKK